MVANFNVKNPPNRKIPKGRVSIKSHYTMMFPEDLLKIIVWRINRTKVINGLPYATFFDSFLGDCVKRMSKSKIAEKLCDAGEFDIMTACLN